MSDRDAAPRIVVGAQTLLPDKERTMADNAQTRTIAIDPAATIESFVPGTGLKAKEIVLQLLAARGDLRSLRESYDWLSPEQLGWALIVAMRDLEGLTRCVAKEWHTLIEMGAIHFGDLPWTAEWRPSPHERADFLRRLEEFRDAGH